MQKTADSAGGILDRQHDVRINIHQKHTEGNRKEQQRLKSLADGKIQENERHHNHDHVSDGEVQKGCLLNKVGHGCCKIIH